MTGRTDNAAAAARAMPGADWWKQGRCVGRAALFDTQPGHGRKTAAEKAAIALCVACPVIKQCTARVLGLPEAEDFGGIVAGLTEKERTKLRRKHGPPKECPRCHETKRRTAFSPNARNLDGLHTYCKPCEAARRREAYAAKHGLEGAESPSDGPRAVESAPGRGQNDSGNDFAATNYEINLRDFEIDKEGLTPAENMKQNPHFFDQQGAA